MKFPVNSLLAGNLAFSETSSQLTPPSSGESRANLTYHAGADAVLGATVDDPGRFGTSNCAPICKDRL